MYIMFPDVTHQHSDKKWRVPQSRRPIFSSRGSRPAPRQNGNCHFANPPLTRALAFKFQLHYITALDPLFLL